MTYTEKKIREVIDNLNSYLLSDGGGIEFIKYENSIVYVRMQGACTNCEMLDITLKSGVENAIKEEIPEVKEIININ